MSDDRLTSFLQQVQDDIEWEAAEAFIVQWNKLESKCESPIERLFLAAALRSIKSMHSWLPALSVYLHSDDYAADKLPLVGVHLFCQAKIEQYRVDFLWIWYMENVNGGKPLRFVIECDGHEFHERTKEQATRDKSRDRDLSALGYTVLRFSGSELWRNPAKCGDEVLGTIDAAIRRGLG